MAPHSKKLESLSPEYALWQVWSNASGEEKFEKLTDRWTTGNQKRSAQLI